MTGLQVWQTVVRKPAATRGIFLRIVDHTDYGFFLLNTFPRTESPVCCSVLQFYCRNVHFVHNDHYKERASCETWRWWSRAEQSSWRTAGLNKVHDALQADRHLSAYPRSCQPLPSMQSKKMCSVDLSLSWTTLFVYKSQIQLRCRTFKQNALQTNEAAIVTDIRILSKPFSTYCRYSDIE